MSNVIPILVEADADPQRIKSVEADNDAQIKRAENELEGKHDTPVPDPEPNNQ